MTTTNYKQWVTTNYPMFTPIEMVQELNQHSVATVYLTVDVPIQVVSNLKVLAKGNSRLMATNFNIDGNRITFSANCLNDMCPLLSTITQ
ncbi:hypothetical protein L2089_15490 [Paenibacillus hunanensis]|uniref:hypothetical protein n=1 Tax=Paenibacillus hunanensis TaxID=539262 RepID=UPI0020273793|nr:hypothetical protein [Paenibacillus hunanensis]MCL9662097.1 hypothetical protein [Paenibacillus hunanensis]